LGETETKRDPVIAMKKARVSFERMCRMWPNNAASKLLRSPARAAFISFST